MEPKITCKVKRADGTSKKYKIKPGENFQGPKLKHDAPKEDEILTERNWYGGISQTAFYRYDAKPAFPLSRDEEWRQEANEEEDKDFALSITREALLEVSTLEMKANIQLMGVGVIIMLIILHWIW